MVDPRRLPEGVRVAVTACYEEKGYSCTHTVLEILGRYFDFPVPPQVMDAASGLHGAGRYGAQCGLVEGVLMFIGLRSCALGYDQSHIESLSSDWAAHFERCFGSLICRELRPEGFGHSVPPLKCLSLTVSAVKEAISVTAPFFPLTR